ncbi:putative MFS family arabinose efflux permease [Caulobacter rhizosphaerae]|uniref:MFS family arabinose efflux permease n=1 Tax=Caulobacter rhizosphaerae TaxID=2010972 RepID=A0ABU1MVJ5_9CAUL|nr:MFS transporter [Caulobacter rhizosphaerae]MDR6530217.1 putative MFS family arabinose efflux permease [Caulobacter rhizosphaerae]
MVTPSSAAARLSTRLSFLVAGFSIASWAPLVPFAKARLAVDDGAMGLLLLCLGLGSVVAMSATGALSARHGSRPIIIVGGLGVAVFLPLLAMAASPLALGAALVVFGAALGSLDVAMNIQAIDVERASGRPLMSGFHALFSIGGFAGASAMTFMLSLGAAPTVAALVNGVLMLAAMGLAAPRLLRAKGDPAGPLLVVPRGPVLLLSALAAATFLAEGAMLDWSALLITQAGLVSVARGGLGYMLFALAMTAGRLVGDMTVARLGDLAVLRWGGGLAVLGFLVLLVAPIAWIGLAGFALIGLGAANIVPVLFRLAGAQQAMPAAQAISALTTIGYAGILVGPAGLGAVAKAVGLGGAFWLLAGLLSLTPLLAGRIVNPLGTGRQVNPPGR